MNAPLDVKECPKCGSRDLGEGVLKGYAAMTPRGSWLRTGSPIISTLCTKCGYIIQSYVENPKRFKK